MNPARFALRNRTVMVVLTLLVIGAGLVAYRRLGRLEYPTFTIKTAVITTPYPGAGPAEVEDEVTDVVEEAIQEMGQLKEIRSISREGLSVIYADMKDRYRSDDLPQVWDELRRKVGAAQASLPPGAGPSVVNDDFGDVYGVFYAIAGEGYTYAELKDYADRLKKEILLCDDVAKVAFWGVQQEVIYVEMDRARMAELGLSPSAIFGTLASQNLVQPSGKVAIDDEYIRITPTGEFDSESMIGDLLIGGADSLLRLRDVATIRRAYEDPPRSLMRFNGRPAVGLGVSTVAGGNVIVMGDAVKARLAELEAIRPLGMQIHTINFQSQNVSESVHTFVMNLIQAVIIVIVLLMLFMGWQSGMLIGAVLLMTIFTTFIFMALMDINLQIISLGALIIALGMLVDNAIVVADGILVRVEKGESREEAAADVVADTQWPLFGATLVAILAFAAIGFAPGNVGEFCRSLFKVLALSLSISWVLAVTVTPLFCVWFLKIPEVEGADPYDRRMFRGYRRFLEAALRWRWLSVGITAGLLVLAVIGFSRVSQYFFPDSTRNQFYVDYWHPEGSHIESTARDIGEISAAIRQLEGVVNTTTFIGRGALRFILPYNSESPNPSYGQILVRVDDYRRIGTLIQTVQAHLAEYEVGAETKVHRFANGPSIAYKLEARFRGPEYAVLHDLAEETKAIFRAAGAVDIRDDWRQPVKTLRPVYSEAQARRTGIARSDLARALQWTFGGQTVGLYREGDEMLPIVARPPDHQRESVTALKSIQVWSPLLSEYLPLGQVVSRVRFVWEPPLVHRRDRVRTLTVQANPAVGLVDPLFRKVRDEVEAMELPAGYSMEWGGEYESSEEAREPLRKAFPVCMLGMFVITVCLFNSIRKPLIIFLCVPLAIIGVTAGLLAFDMPFGFMAILGFLGLSGMLIKNAVVLIDQVELELKQGKSEYEAVVHSAVSRMRPVLMASGTTILGMTPLIRDPFYSVMAATMMSGLLGGTLLTLVVVPVLYVIFFRVHPEPAAP